MGAGLVFARTASATWRGLLVASLLAPAAVASARPASAQAEIELLSATLTPAQQPPLTLTDGRIQTFIGCQQAVSERRCSTHMTDHDFTEEAVNYIVKTLVYIREESAENVAPAISIVFNPGLSTRLQTMTLHVGDSALAFPAARGSYDGNSFSDRTWDIGFEWTEGTPVSIRLTRPNVAPTAVDGGVGTYLNEAYTFEASDFGFSDVDEEHGQSLQNVRIVALPASGTVMLGGTAVTAGESVAKGDLDAGRLTYTQPGTDPEDASFTFKVSDGTAESDGPYTMDIEVRSPAPGPPENLTAAAGDGAATLGWEAPANSGASAIVRYEVRHAAANSVPMNTAWQSVGLTLSHSITGLTNGQVYTFEVRAVNGSNPAEGPAAEVRATPAPVVSITPGFLSVAEDAGEAVLTVSLHRPAESALSVSWHTQDERADAPNDYTARQEAVTFAAGEDRKTISVPIVDDAVREDPVHDVHETFFVILQAGQGYSRSDSSYALVEIVDNDGDALGDVTPPRLLQRTVNGTTLVLTYDETLDDASVPAPGDFVVQSGGNTINVSQVSVDGSKVTLTLAVPVQPSQAVSIDYTPGATPIQDASGNDAGPISGMDVRPPRLTRATVNGSTLVLSYDETLDGVSVPSAGDFVVTAAGSATGVNGVRVGGSAVTLTLATPVQANQAVTLDYTPGANPTQDVAGNDAAALSGQAVTNNTPGSGEGSGGGGDPSVPGAPASLTATAGDEEVALVWSAPADDGGAPVTGYEYRYAAGDAVPGTRRGDPPGSTSSGR